MNEENKFSKALQFGCLIKAFPSLQYTDLKKIFIFISLLVWLHWVLVEEYEIFS